jgi:uncharacterized integral membrane protein
MKLFILLLLLILTAIAGFAVLNWNIFITPTQLSLGFTTAQIPLGLVMLGLLAFLTALFLIFLLYRETSALLEARRHSRELQASRELAEQAEASRFTELRNFLEAEMLKLTNLHTESESKAVAKIEQVENNLRVTIEQAGNTLAAYIGELEDRLEKTKNPSGSG